MALEDSKSIDAIGIDNEKNCVTLALIDSHDWINEEQHLLLLQEKLNTYLSFIESGEIYSSYKGAEGREIEISIHFKYDISENCTAFLDNVQETIRNAGFIFNYRIG